MDRPEIIKSGAGTEAKPLLQFCRGQSPRGCPVTLAARDSSSEFHVTSGIKELLFVKAAKQLLQKMGYLLSIKFQIHNVKTAILTNL